MSYLEVQNYHQTNFFKNSQREFFISDTNSEQSVFTINYALPVFSISNLIPHNLFSLSGSDRKEEENNKDERNSNIQSLPNSRFKLILWSIIAGTRGGVNRARILNLIKETPLNANKIATMLSLDHKTVVHHIKILSKNELVIKAEKSYAAEFELSQIMRENQEALEEIMQKIGTK